MKVLEMNRKLFLMYGILSKSEEKPKIVQQLLKLFTNFRLILPSISISLCSAIYISHNLTNPSAMLNASINFYAGLSAIAAYVGFVSNEKNINLLYQELEEIIGSDKWATEIRALEIYRRAEKQCERITKYIAIYWLRIGWSISILPLIALSIVSMVAGNFDPSTWVFLMEMEVPFGVDPSTISGWYMRTFVYACGVWSYCAIVSNVIPFIVGACVYVKACCNHLKMIFEECDEIIGAKWDNKDEQIIAITEKMKGAVDLHAKIIRICELISNISSSTIFALFLSSFVVLISSMCNIELQIQCQGMGLLFYLACASTSIVLPYLLCYAATTASSKVTNIGNIVYDSKWYEYPPIMRKYIILMIAQSQKPVHITGLKLIPCTLETFSQLCNTAVSYYLTFRQL